MMELPTVTEANLLNFHHQHFARAPLPSGFFINHNDAAVNDCDEYNDDLGYYPDGVQRTLTDEDIAWLREREIKDLLRKRDAELSEQSEQSPSPPADDEAQALEEPLANSNTSPASPLQADTPESADTAASARPIVQYDKSFMKGLPAFSAAPVPYVPRGQSQNPNGVQKSKKKNKRNKKKRNTQPVSLGLEEGEVTYRRLARDADEIEAEEVEMEY